MSTKKQIISVLVDAIDLEKLSTGMLDSVLVPALNEIVADSSNKIDDAAVAMLLPLLEPKLKEYIAKEIAVLKEKVAAIQ